MLHNESKRQSLDQSASAEQPKTAAKREVPTKLKTAADGSPGNKSDYASKRRRQAKLFTNTPLVPPAFYLFLRVQRPNDPVKVDLTVNSTTEVNVELKVGPTVRSDVWLFPGRKSGHNWFFQTCFDKTTDILTAAGECFIGPSGEVVIWAPHTGSFYETFYIGKTLEQIQAMGIFSIKPLDYELWERIKAELQKAKFINENGTLADGYEQVYEAIKRIEEKRIEEIDSSATHTSSTLSALTSVPVSPNPLITAISRDLPSPISSATTATLATAATLATSTTTATSATPPTLATAATLATTATLATAATLATTATTATLATAATSATAATLATAATSSSSFSSRSSSSSPSSRLFPSIPPFKGTGATLQPSAASSLASASLLASSSESPFVSPVVSPSSSSSASPLGSPIGRKIPVGVTDSVSQPIPRSSSANEDLHNFSVNRRVYLPLSSANRVYALVSPTHLAQTSLTITGGGHRKKQPTSPLTSTSTSSTLPPIRKPRRV